MKAGSSKLGKTCLVAAGILATGLSATRLWGDEPGRLGRLLGLGNNSRSTASASNSSTGSASTPSGAASAYAPTSMSAGNSATGSKLVAQPRNTKAATEADPLVTRISLCRAEDGKQFCSFLQVFADGTVMDSEGVHKVGADLLRPIAQTIQSGDLTRLKGHCGGPAADYVEQVHTVVYERSLGRLRAHAFSYSGNPQGCDPAVRQLNAAVDAIQTKLMGPPIPAAATTPTNVPAGQPMTSGGRPLTLTPIP